MENQLKHQELSQYHFADGIFTFWVANYGPPTKSLIVFRVRADTPPHARVAQVLKPGWKKLYPANKYEIFYWKTFHPSYPVLEIIDPSDDSTNNK